GIDAAADSTTANPANSSEVYPRMGETFSTGTGNPWNANETWVYTGQFFDADGIVAFGTAIDDGAFLKIDGASYLNYSSNITIASGTLNIGMGPSGDGWHNIDIRVENGGGNGGSA